MKTKNLLLAISLSSAVLLSCNEGSTQKETTNPPLANDGNSSTDTIPETGLQADSIPEDSVFYEIPDEKEDVDLFLSSEVEAPKAKVDVVIHAITGYGDNENFARAAADTLEVILNSRGFKRAVEKATYDMGRGRTSKQIYEGIMKAKEEAGDGGKDNVLDFRMRTITLKQDKQKWIDRCTKRRPDGKITVGKDGGGTGVMATCENWIKDRAKGRDHANLARHMIHEYMHILGYSHKDAEDKDKTVPYKIGKIVKTLGKNYRARN